MTQVDMRLKMWEPLVQAMAAFKSSNVEDKMGLITQLGESWWMSILCDLCKVSYVCHVI